jgi:hypothetical protein
MANTRRLELALVSDASQFNKGFDQAQRKVDTFGKSVDRAATGGLGKMDSRMGALSKTLGTFGAALGAAAVGKFVNDSVRAFSDLNESMNAVNVTFGDSSEGIKKLGEEAARSVGLSNSAFNSFAVSFSAFAESIASIDGGDVVQVVDDITTRVADFASVMNIDVAEAARLFQSGLAGETEPLRKFGIDLSAANVNAVGLAAGLTGVGDEFTEQEKVLSRYNSLMEQTNKTAGDFANTSDGLANAQRIAAAELENTKAVIGEAFAEMKAAGIPIAGDLAKAMGVLAISIGQVTLGYSDATAAMKTFELLSGKSAETADAALTILVDKLELLGNRRGPGDAFGDFMADLVSSSGLGIDQLVRLSGASDEFLASLGFTASRIETFRDLVGNELVLALGASADAEKAAAQGATDYTRAAKGAVEPTTEMAAALEEIHKKGEKARISLAGVRQEFLLAGDPIFAAVDALARVSSAEEALIEVRKDEASTAADIAQAELDIAEARLGAESALGALGGGDLEAGIDSIATALGKTHDETVILLETLGLLDGMQVNTIVTTTFKVAGKQFAIDAATGSIGSGSGGMGFAPPGGHSSGGLGFATGGVVPGPIGKPLLATVHGGETIIPTGGASSFGGSNSLSIQINNPPDRPSVKDIQRELLLAGVGRWAETNG